MQSVNRSTVVSEKEYQLAKRTVLNYLKNNPSINNSIVRGLTNLNYDQALKFFNRSLTEGILIRVGKTSGTKYVPP